MERRTFLKLAASAAVAAASQVAIPWAAAAAAASPYVSFAGSLYRTGGGGKIETSTDGGRSWALHSDLGDMYTITKLAVVRRNTRLRLTVGYVGRTFPLVLGRDKRSWLTA
jgi:hypothetical protein